MAETVEVAIYKMGLQGVEQFAAGAKIMEIFSRAGDKATISVEKLDKAHRVSEERWTKLLGKIDPAIKATTKIGEVTKTLADYQEQAIGVAGEYAVVTENMVNNILKGAGVVDKLGLSFQDLKANFSSTVPSVEQLNSEFEKLSAGINVYVKDANLAEAATKVLAVSFNTAKEASQKFYAEQRNRTTRAGTSRTATGVVVDRARDEQAATDAQAEFNKLLGVKPMTGAQDRSRFGSALQDLAELEDQAAAAAIKAAARFEQLQEKIDPATASAKRMAKEIADLNEYVRLGGTVSGGLETGIARVAEKYDEGAQAAKRMAEAQRDLVETERGAQTARNSQHAINTQLGVDPKSGAGSAAASAQAFIDLYEAEDQLIAVQKALAATTQSLTQEFDPATTSALAMSAELARLNKAQELGVTIAGGYTAAYDRIIAKYDEGTQAAKRLAAAQRDLIESERSAQFSRNAQQAFNDRLGVDPDSGKGTAAASASVFAEDFRLSDAAQKVRDQVNPTLPVLRAYGAEIDNLSELLDAHKISSLEAAIEVDRLSTSYDKLLKAASGADKAELFRDKLDPTRPVERARTETLEKIDKAAAAPGGLNPTEKAAAIKAANEEYDKQIKVVTGVAKAEADAATAAAAYRKQLIAVVDAIDPVATLQKRYNEELDFLNHATAKGDISLAQRDAGYVTAKKNLDNSIETLKRYEKATQASTAASRQMQFALTNLSFQANDIVSSLGAGISVQQTFFQQAGQVFQIGQQVGFKNLTKSIWDMVTPLKVAAASVLALGAGFAFIVTRATSATSSVRQFDVMLRGIGASGLSSGAELEASAKRLRDIGLSASEARDRLRDVTRAGLNPAAAERIVRVQEDLKPILGDQAPDQLKAALSGGLEDTIKLGLSPALRVFNADQIATWREMARGGQASRALNQAFAEIEKAVKGTANNALSPTARSLRELGVRWSNLLDKLGDTGPIRGTVAALSDLAGVLERIANIAGGEKAATVIGALTGVAVGYKLAGPYGAVALGAAGAVGGAYAGARGETIRQEESVRASALIPPATRGTAAAAVSSAESLLGAQETKDAARIRTYLGWADNLNPKDIAWCAAFANAALARQGFSGTGSNVATSFLDPKWGTTVTGAPQAGDILVQPKGHTFGETGGHVGLATGNVQGTGADLQYEMLSGNSGPGNDAVTKAWVRANELVVKRAVDAASGVIEAGARTTKPLTTGQVDSVDNWETRNNNFGGLRKPGVNAGPNAGGFQSFATPEEGVAAIARQLDRYFSGATTGTPITTQRGIINTWAPPNENPTSDLLSRSVKITGINADVKIDLNDQATKAKLIEAIIRNEQGGKLPVDPTIISRVASRPAATAASASGAPNVDREKTVTDTSEVTKITNEKERQIEVLKREGALAEVVEAQHEAARVKAEKELEPQQALRLEADLIANVYKRKAAEQNKIIGQTDREITGVKDTAKAYGESAESGLRAEAQAKATGEAFQLYGELQSEASKSFIDSRASQLLSEQAHTAVMSAREQLATAQPRVVAEAKLLDATLKGTEAAHQQELQNLATARAQEAITKAGASRLPGLSSETKAVEAAALAEEKLKDAISQGTRAAQAANDNKKTIQQVKFETSVVSSNVSPAEQTRQLAYYDALQKAATEFANVDVDERAKAARDAYIQTAKAVADAKYELTKVQQEQQRWNDLVSSLANSIDTELTRSIENAFSEDKVESWGKRIQKWLGTATSSLSSSLFIKPALGTVAGALGFGGAAASLGSFNDLLGTGTTGTSSNSSSGPSVTKNTDGSITLKDFESTASLSKGLFGDSGGSSWFSNLGKNLGFATTTPGLSKSEISSLGDLIGIEPSSLSYLGETTKTAGSLFSGTLGSTLGSVATGFGAGSLVNSLLGGEKLGGSAGSGVGSLAGSLAFGPIGGILGGALGGAVGGLFGNSKASNKATGVSIDLGTGKASGFTSSGNKENDKDTKEIRDSLSKFTKSIQTTSGGALSGYVNPQVGTRDGIQLDYNIPGYGSGTYKAADTQDAIDTAELAISRGLTGISTTMKTVIDQVTDPADLDAAIKFAKQYEKLAEAAKDSFASIPSDLNVDGPFKKAKDDIKDTFDAIADDAETFGLDMKPVTDALDEANKRLTADFNRYIKDLTVAMDDPLQSLVDIEKRAGEARVKDAKAVAGDVEAVNKLNAKNLDKIWTDSTKTLKDLSDELKTGDLSGLTATQRLKSANDNYTTVLADVQAGKTGKFDELVTAAKDVFSLSTSAYGQGPKTASLRTDITKAIDAVLASRSFAGGTMATPPGMILVGERGPELIGQMKATGRVFAEGTAKTPPGTILVGEKGPELISQPGGLQVYTHRETERIMAAANTNTAVASSASNVIDITPKLERSLANRAYAAGTMATPSGTILVGEQGRELMGIPQGRAFADGTTGHDSLVYRDNWTAPSATSAQYDNSEEVGLLRDLLDAMRANTGTARVGHLETGRKLDETNAKLEKAPLPYEPTRRKVG